MRILFFLLLLTSCVQSRIAERQPAETHIVTTALPPVKATEKQEDRIWNEYCVGERKSTDTPSPNYYNGEVQSVARKLAMVYPQSFYFYTGPLYIYGLRQGKELVNVPEKFPMMSEVKNGKKNAHTFLTVLCGEFRDRPTLIRDKIKWADKLYKLPVAAQKKMKMSDNVWANITAQSYLDYIQFSVVIYNMKKVAAESTVVKMGDISEPAPVEPYTICETKYIFHNYIVPARSKEVPTLGDYQTGYNKFKGKCTKTDLAYLYDFRGDSNYKPNSPESNGMIWYSSAIANSCVRSGDKIVLKDKIKDKFKNQDICTDYYKAPFAHRWTAARAGLATWLFHSKANDQIFSNAKNTVNVTANYDQLNNAFDYITLDTSVTDKVLTEWAAQQKEFWARPDMGFNTIMGLGTPEAKKQMTFERLRNAVNRHTDWYQSGYNDLVSAEQKTQAYSPFVASSFEMDASDGFTSPGITVNSPADGCKHWMFVFKIKKDRWYSSQQIAQGEKVNFNENWFDETSLGTNDLANYERALDRLGTTLEGEMDTIMYLNNITANEVDIYGQRVAYGAPKDKCGEGFVK